MALRRYFEAHLAIKLEQVKQSLQRTEGGILVHPQPPYKVSSVLQGEFLKMTWEILVLAMILFPTLFLQSWSFLIKTNKQKTQPSFMAAYFEGAHLPVVSGLIYDGFLEELK